MEGKCYENRTLITILVVFTIITSLIGSCAILTDDESEESSTGSTSVTDYSLLVIGALLIQSPTVLMNRMTKVPGRRTLH